MAKRTTDTGTGMPTEAPTPASPFVDDEHRHVFAILTAIRANRRWCNDGFTELLRTLELPHPDLDERSDRHRSVTVRVPFTAAVHFSGGWYSREEAVEAVDRMMVANERSIAMGNRGRALRPGLECGQFVPPGHGHDFTFDLDAATFEGLPDPVGDAARRPHAAAVAATDDLVKIITDGLRAAYTGDRYRGRYAKWPVPEYQDGTDVPTVSPYLAKVVRRAVRGFADADITFGELRAVTRLLGLPTPPNRGQVVRTFTFTLGETGAPMRFGKSGASEAQARHITAQQLFGSLTVVDGRRLVNVGWAGRLDVTSIVPATVEGTAAALTLVTSDDIPAGAQAWFTLMEKVFAGHDDDAGALRDLAAVDDSDGDDPF